MSNSKWKCIALPETYILNRRQAAFWYAFGGKEVEGRGGEKGPLEEKLENEKESVVLFILLIFQEFKGGINILKAVGNNTEKKSI